MLLNDSHVGDIYLDDYLFHAERFMLNVYFCLMCGVMKSRHVHASKRELMSACSFGLGRAGQRIVCQVFDLGGVMAGRLVLDRHRAHS